MSNRKNDTIRAAIQRIAEQGRVSRITGEAIGSGGSRITGFVKKIHDDESDELFGTIDVQEFYTPSFSQDENDVEAGLHEGVYLSAIQNNQEGFLIIPKLYSEVTIAQDTQSQTEFVVMYSHVDIIQLDSHEKVSVGVREREDFDDDEEGDDISELKLTGIKTNTTYTKDSVTTEVQADKDGKQTASQIIGKDNGGTVLIKQVVGDDKSSQTMTEDDIVLEHSKGKVILDDSQSRMEQGQSSVTVEDGTVYVGSKSGTDDAVLGQQLASILSELVGYLGQAMTPTMMGPQPPANVLGSFMSLKAKIQSFASAHSGFLTKKVQIQK